LQLYASEHFRNIPRSVREVEFQRLLHAVFKERDLHFVRPSALNAKNLVGLRGIDVFEPVPLLLVVGARIVGHEEDLAGHVVDFGEEHFLFVGVLDAIAQVEDVGIVEEGAAVQEAAVKGIQHAVASGWDLVRDLHLV